MSSTQAESSSAATPRESRKKGRMPGSKNFTDHEIFTYIKLIHDRLPTGFGEWDTVYKEYNKWAESNGFTKRPQESLKKQWNQRVNAIKTIDDPRCPWDVQLVKKILQEIEAGHQIYNIDDSDGSTLEGNPNRNSSNSNNANSESAPPPATSQNHPHNILPMGGVGVGAGPFTPFSPSGSSLEQEGFNNPHPRSPINSPLQSTAEQQQRRLPQQIDVAQPSHPPAATPSVQSSSEFRRPSRPQQSSQDPEIGRFLEFSRQADHEPKTTVHHFLERESYEKSLQIIRLEDKLERIQSRHADELARLQEKVERLDRRNRKLEQDNHVLKIKHMLLRGDNGDVKRKRSRISLDIESEKEDGDEESDDEGAAYTVAPEAVHEQL